MCLRALRKRRDPPSTCQWGLGADPTASLLLRTRCRSPASPLPAFSMFMVEAAGTGVAAAGSRVDAGGSLVAGVGARCRFSSRCSPAVSCRACIRQRKQDGELRCSDRARRGGHGAGGQRFTGLPRRSERGGRDGRTWANPRSEGLWCWEGATTNLLRCFQLSLSLSLLMQLYQMLPIFLSMVLKQPKTLARGQG